MATNNSGYMFIGVIGYTYSTGLASFWLMLGWILGDYLASRWVHPRLRRAAAAGSELSFVGLVSDWNGGVQPALKRLLALLTLIFLLAYTSAQLVAGSKALSGIFAWPQWAGAVLAALYRSVPSNKHRQAVPLPEALRPADLSEHVRLLGVGRVHLRRRGAACAAG